jgi:cytoskeletal protein CcmA (bactofilin family)
MAFRKFGGLDYASRNNIVRSHYSNIDNSTISNTLGLLNSKVVLKSHLDLSGSSIMDIGGIYFQNGSSLTDGTYSGNLTVSKKINIVGNCSVGGSLTIGGAINFSNSFGVTGDLSVDGTLTVDKATHLNNSLNVSGACTVGSLTISNSFHINNVGCIDVCGNIVMSGTSGTNYLEFPDGTKQYSASASTSTSSSNANNFTVNAQTAPCPLAGITNAYNTGGYAGQYFSNIKYSYINLWIDFQSFPKSGINTYNDSLSVEYKVYFDDCPSATTPSSKCGECSGIIKLFPKRFVSKWGTNYTGVSQANVLNNYTGLLFYNSTNVNYAPYGRQYYCHGITNSGSNNVNYANLYGGESYALIQFISPFSGGAYCATCSLRVLDSTLLQINSNSAANQGVKVYINYQV